MVVSWLPLANSPHWMTLWKTISIKPQGEIRCLVAHIMLPAISSTLTWSAILKRIRMIITIITKEPTICREYAITSRPKRTNRSVRNRWIEWNCQRDRRLCIIYAVPGVVLDGLYYYYYYYHHCYKLFATSYVEVTAVKKKEKK